ncbi:hypothetical protein OBBRIDRAFT_640142 [Obba rivulosa]|uniref:Uncharacterized protein n=1 Tax=Obba rivulosa TaxID=1052685 RepID=A0A8E2ARV5_9APHY|nr:hypothetical protein OBBRIDRAFT_640142 [Obba rivulosa]
MALTSQPAWPARETVLLTGWIQTTRDAMLIVEGARTGRVPRVTRRFHDIERQNMLKSGAILVFTEEESGIKRWTDVFDWSPSRMLGNFLIYRERAEEQPALSDELPEIKPDPCTALLSIADSYLERCIFGSWRHGKNLKEDGMMKKTLSLEIEDIVYHIISYYRPSDVLSGLLHTPSSMEHMSDIKITYETTEATSKLRQPPQIKWDNEGRIISV